MIEDDPDYASIAQAWLSQGQGDSIAAQPSRFSLILANSLESAQRILFQEKFDIILLDLNLPDSNGVDTLYRLSPTMMDTPVVILSGNDDDEEINIAALYGAEDFLIKGQVNKTQLIRAIRSAMARHSFSKPLVTDGNAATLQKKAIPKINSANRDLQWKNNHQNGREI